MDVDVVVVGRWSLVLLLLLCLLRLLLSVVATCLQENKENYAETIFLQSAAGTPLFSVAMLQTWPKFGQNLKTLVEREISSRVGSGQKPVECDCRQAPRGSLKRSASVASLRKSASSSSLPSVLSEGDNHDMVPGAEASVPADADTPESQIVVHGKRLSWNRDLAPHMETVHRSFLIKRINDLQKKLTQSKQELVKAKRENGKSTKKLTQLQLQIQQKDHAVEQADEQVLTVQKTQKGVRFTTRGYLAMGIRKALAITSALGFPLSALVDASRQTVVRSEVCVWSVLVARTGCFHEMVKHRLRALASIYACMKKAAEQSHRSDISATDALVSAVQQTSGPELNDDISRFGEENIVSGDLGLVPSFADSDTQSSSAADPVSRWFCMGSGGGVSSEQIERVFCLGGTAFAGDATNSGIWRRNKLQGLLLTSACMTDSVSLAHSTEYMKAFAFHTNVILELHMCKPCTHVLYLCLQFLIWFALFRTSDWITLNTWMFAICNCTHGLHAACVLLSVNCLGLDERA